VSCWLPTQPTVRQTPTASLLLPSEDAACPDTTAPEFRRTFRPPASSQLNDHTQGGFKSLPTKQMHVLTEVKVGLHTCQSE